MLAVLLFAAFWVVLGLGVFVLAFRGGPAPRPVGQPALHGARRTVAWVLALIFIGFGIVLPVVFLSATTTSQRPGRRDQADRSRKERTGAVRPALRRCAIRWPRPTPSARWARTSTCSSPPRSWCSTRSRTDACRTRRRVARRHAWARGRCRPTSCRASTRPTWPSSSPRSRARSSAARLARIVGKPSARRTRSVRGHR